MPNDCPICSGPGNALGTLGRRVRYRCQDCGAMFSALDDDEFDEPGVYADADHPRRIDGCPETLDH